MHWRDQGFLLSSRPHGETAAILEIFTENHGRHLGFLRGGASRKLASTLQIGTQLTVEWRARLAGQLGIFTIEPVRVRAAILLQDQLALAALTSASSLLTRILAERESTTHFYHQTIELLDKLENSNHWMSDYLHWELRLLEEAGRGLDLSHCALSGVEHGLCYVSPKTGRAVTAEAAGKWSSKLLIIPTCMVGGECNGMADFFTGLRLTSHFLRLVLSDTGNPDITMTPRQRLEDLTNRLMQKDQSG